MSEPLKLGMIGLDTSHCVAFAKLLHDEDNAYHIPGARITAAFPGGSPDMELSRERLPGYKHTLSTEYGVKIEDSIEAVVEQCDAILLESVDGRVHKEQFAKIAPYGKPTFIDKPLAVTLRDALAIQELAERHGVAVLSSSALRYSEALQTAIAEAAGIAGADCYGPMALQPTQPGMFWYGIHMTDMVFAALGPDCVQVQAVTSDDHDLIVGTWRDGRIGTVRGNRVGNQTFGALIHREEGTQWVDVASAAKPFYASLLEEVLAMFHDGTSRLSLRETVKVVQFMEAANESRRSGRPVALEGSS